MKVSKLIEVRLNNHQTHLEDLVLFGKEGIEELNDKVDKFIRRFDNSKKELNLTQKIDGAPALFVWHKFSGYPDNSIALKGFTSGPNTAMSSVEQIDAKYADRPGMAEKLKLGLQLAKYIPEGECWQGDCLFSHDDIREEEINGKNYLTFQPNKIVYAFSEENADYNKVANSDFGICFHTIYKDAGDGNKSQSFDVDPSRINAPDNFYIMSPAINASKDKNDYDLSALENEYNKLKQLEQKLISDHHYEELVNNSTFMNYWNTFENANLADKKQVNINVDTFINELKDYIKDKQTKEYNKKLNTLKTDQGKQKATDKYNADVQALQDIVENNKSTLVNLVNVLNSTANIKMMMWAGLKKAKNDYSTFYKSRTKGYVPSEGEGIAMSTDDGNIVKIVDRAKFSSINRNDDYLSGFMHESILIREMLATQRGDIGSFNKFTKKLTLDEDESQKTAVVAFGRFNPPHIGHRKLAKAMADAAQGEKAKIYLSHKVNSIKDPLSYDSKLRWAQKEWGDLVDVIPSKANNAWEVLEELYNQGYTDIIYAGGEDRIGGSDDIYSALTTNKEHNEYVTKGGDLLYKFNSISPLNAGRRDPDSFNNEEKASASLLRKLVAEDNFDEFKKFVYLNEADAYGLFKELKYAMTGKEESFLESCEKRIKSLREASTTLNTPLGNVLKKYIGNDVEYKSLNQGRHPKETLRINSQKSKEELINDLKRKLSSVPNDPITLNGVEYHISKINFNDIGPHDGASHEYDSIPVEVESDNDKQVFYISLATKDDKFASSKLYTPNKVLGNGIGHFVKNSSLEFNEGYEFLEKIYKEAIGNAKGDLKGFESHVSSVEGVNETNINSVMKDFGEVLSAGCLAHVLGSPEEVYFPAASNEPLVDFIVNGTIKVSQKAGSGAAPSGDSIFGLISDSKLNANQILVDYSKNDIKRIMAMISFFRNYVFDSSVSIHNGYVNMAEAVISGKINFVDLPNLSSVQKYFKPNSVTGKNMERFIDSMKPLIGSNIKYDPRKISNQDYCETIRNRYIARILIVSVNRDEVLIKGMNTLLSACLGEFVQVYLINPTEFLKGHFIFKVKQIDSSHEYVLSDASAIDAKNRIGTKKLSMKLK